MCCVESIPPWAINQKILPGPNRVKLFSLLRLTLFLIFFLILRKVEHVLYYCSLKKKEYLAIFANCQYLIISLSVYAENGSQSNLLSSLQSNSKHGNHFN